MISEFVSTLSSHFLTVFYTSVSCLGLISKLDCALGSPKKYKRIF